MTCLLVILEASSIKSQQHYCPNVSQMRMTLVNLKKKKVMKPQPYRKNHMQLRKARSTGIEEERYKIRWEMTFYKGPVDINDRE